MVDRPAAVVLVHGAWHGAWCWEPVVDRLEAAGTRVVAVDLPGHGDDLGPFTDLHGDADRVREVLDSFEEPVVLVGHSYGGAVVTEAGDHPSVARLVYLCALALDAGETCGSAAADESARLGISHTGRPNLAAGVIADDQGMVTVEPSIAAACLYNRCDGEAAKWALARLGPQPFVTLEQMPARVAWRVKPSTYVVCSDDMAVHPDLQRVLAKRCTESVEWDTDHSPFLSCPDRLSTFLVDLASALPG
jgi:pimeloyl-ACP methyl ester carboxylesterase